MSTLNRRSLLRLGWMSGAAAVSGAGTLAGAAQSSRSRNAVLGNGGLHHVAIRVRDWDRTLHYYQEILGCSVKMAWEEGTGTLSERLAQGKPRNQRWAYLDVGGGSYIEIFEDPSFTPPPPGQSDPTRNPGGALVHFGLRTSNLDAVCDRARKHGEIVLGTPTDFTLHTTTGQGPVVVRICFLQGPNSEYIELLQGAP